MVSLPEGRCLSRVFSVARCDFRIPDGLLAEDCVYVNAVQRVDSFALRRPLATLHKSTTAPSEPTHRKPFALKSPSEPPRNQFPDGGLENFRPEWSGLSLFWGTGARKGVSYQTWSSRCSCGGRAARIPGYCAKSLCSDMGVDNTSTVAQSSRFIPAGKSSTRKWYLTGAHRKKPQNAALCLERYSDSWLVRPFVAECIGCRRLLNSIVSVLRLTVLYSTTALTSSALNEYKSQV